MSENGKLVTFKADEATYEAAVTDLEHGELSQELRHKLDELAHGAEVSELKRVRDQLQEYREERRKVDSDIQALKREREEWDRKIERAEQRLADLEGLDGKYDGMLETIESQLHDGVRFTNGSPAVKEAASVVDGDPTGVIGDLKERNPDVPDYAFRESRHDEPPRWTEQQGHTNTNTNTTL